MSESDGAASHGTSAPERRLVALATAQIEFSRAYTLRTLEGLDDDEWYRRPPGCSTHVAWQVGHLAMAEYALTMLRIRGKEPEDQAVIANDFFKRFKKGSTPGDPAEAPAPAELREVLGRVHARALAELATRNDAELQVEPLPEPYAVFPDKLGSLFFCASHELVHAGQIGLLRRLLGHPPVRG